MIKTRPECRVFCFVELLLRDGFEVVLQHLTPKRHMQQSGASFSIPNLRSTIFTIAESLDISAYALKRLLNPKITNTVTAGYIIPDVERLRTPMQKITDFILI